MKNLKELEDKITFLEQVLLPTKNISTVSLLDKIEFIEKRFTESNLKPQIAFLQKGIPFILMNLPKINFSERSRGFIEQMQ